MGNQLAMTTKHSWLRWLAGGIALVVLGLAVWLAQSQGWLSAAYAWGRGLIAGKEADKSQGDSMAGMPGMKMGNGGAEEESKSDVEGYAPVVIEPGIQQQIGVTTGEVQVEPLKMSVQTVGIVQPNETKTARIHLRTQGWVENLSVNFTGQAVEKGDPLLAIYSPDFLAAQQEYLVARQTKVGGMSRESGQTLADAALQKMRLWGIPVEELRELERTGRPQVTLTLRSPVSGTVLEKNVLEGEYVTPDRQLYVISDLSTVWVQAKIYQYELPHVALGKPATVTVPGLPDQRFEGKVIFIQPTVEAATRTVQVRVELPNPDGLLKPDMFVEVVIEHPMGNGLLVPVAAVFRTGERDLVFRAESENRFMPVEVEISPMKFSKERYHVLEGLAAGDRIITSANFLIDSESRLRSGGGMGGMAGMAGMDMPGMQKDGKDQGGQKQGGQKQGGLDHSKMKH